jgi:hypothetical protein
MMPICRSDKHTGLYGTGTIREKSPFCCHGFVLAPNSKLLFMDKQCNVKAKKSRNTAKQPQIRDVFTIICHTDLHVECVKEYKFHPIRKWRFDYAIPKYKIAWKLRAAYGREVGTLHQRAF